MGKHSDFPRRPRDFYPTPFEAVVPLLTHLDDHTQFDEPCAGNGTLISHLESRQHICTRATDIEPKSNIISTENALKLTDCAGDCFITNPPWPMPGQNGDPTVKLAQHLSDIAPCWLLLNADVMHNRYFGKLSDRCIKIVSVGRVSWEQNRIKGKENSAWFYFNKNCLNKFAPIFYGRAA